MTGESSAEEGGLNQTGSEAVAQQNLQSNFMTMSDRQFLTLLVLVGEDTSDLEDPPTEP